MRVKRCWIARWVKAVAGSHRKSCVAVACMRTGWLSLRLAKTACSQVLCGCGMSMPVSMLSAFRCLLCCSVRWPSILRLPVAGIGSALMRHAIDEAKDRGHGAIILVGDPEYYERFGFTAEKTGELAMPGPYEKRRFLALELKPGHLDGAHGILRASGRKVTRVEASLRQSA